MSDLDIEDCKDSKYVYPPARHVITGKLKIISDSQIRSIVAKGPKYRFSNVSQKFAHLVMTVAVIGVSESMWTVIL